MTTRAQVSAAAREVIRVLRQHGIEDGFGVRLGKVGGGCLAHYKARSQFSARGAVFVVSPRLDKAIGPEHNVTPHALLVDTLLHEYGHVIYEWARLRDPALFHEVVESVDGDEEDFAETFAHAMTKRWPDRGMERIAETYGAKLAAERAA